MAVVKKASKKTTVVLEEIANNLLGKIEGTVLTLQIDLSEAGEKSKTGRSLLVATTGGFKPLVELECYDADVLGKMAISLNVTRKL